MRGIVILKMILVFAITCLEQNLSSRFCSVVPNYATNKASCKVDRSKSDVLGRVFKIRSNEGMYSVHNTITIPTCQQASFFIGQMSHYQLVHNFLAKGPPLLFPLYFLFPFFMHMQFSQPAKTPHYDDYPKCTPPKLISFQITNPSNHHTFHSPTKNLCFACQHGYFRKPMTHISLTPTNQIKKKEKETTSDAINIIIIQTIQHVQLNSYPFFFFFFSSPPLLKPPFPLKLPFPLYSFVTLHLISASN